MFPTHTHTHILHVYSSYFLCNRVVTKLMPTIDAHVRQSCRYCPHQAQKALTPLKHVYKVKGSLCIYKSRNFFPYPMWDIIVLMSSHTVLHVCVCVCMKKFEGKNTFFSLYFKLILASIFIHE